METNRGCNVICSKICIIHGLFSDGVLGDPNGVERNHVQLHCVTQAQVLDAEREIGSGSATTPLYIIGAHQRELHPTLCARI